jgi:hypothetical protein
MYKVINEDWIMFERIFKLLDSDVDFSESYAVNKAMDESPIVLTRKWVRKSDIVSIEDSTDTSKETLENDDVFLLSTVFESDLPVVLTLEEVTEVLEIIKPK